MDFKEISSPTIKELFISEIESAIISGRMVPGEPFPTERKLASMMQVSRSIVNQGFAELEAKGFVTIQPRIGTFVADYKTNGNMETFIDILKYNGNRFDKDTFFSMMEVRQLIEYRCTQLACLNSTKESMKPAWDLWKMLGNIDTPNEWAEINFSIHHQISVVSGNTIYPLMWRSFKKATIKFLEDCFVILDVQKNYVNMQKWLRAIENHQETEAAKIMQTMLAHGSKELQEYYFGV